MNDIIKYVITTIIGIGFSSVIFAIKCLWNKVKKQSCVQDAVQKGVQALLRANIISLYNKYIEKGYLPIYERENLQHLYDEYKLLLGNGVIDNLKDKLDELPTESPVK